MSMLVYQSLQIVYKMDWNQDLMGLVDLPQSFRYEIAGIVVLNSLMTFGFERLVNYVSNRNQRKEHR